MPRPAIAIAIARTARAVLLTALLLSHPGDADAQAASPSAPAAAGAVPGRRMRVRTRVASGEAISPEPDRQVDGLLVNLDSLSVTLRLDDGSERRFARGDVEALKLYVGKSRGFGLLAGWVAGIPVAVFVCRNARYECAEGSGIGLVSGITGAVIGWPRWQDVRFP